MSKSSLKSAGRPVSHQKIRAMVQKIVKEYQPEKIILFGSYAWGTPTGDSDVDFLVVKKSHKQSIERERELRMKLIGNYFPPMDFIVYTPKELNERIQMGDFFIRDIMKRGKIIYNEKPFSSRVTGSRMVATSRG